MLLDWEAGRPLELEVILGNPVKIARAKGYEMPRLQSMYALLKVGTCLDLAHAAKLTIPIVQLAQKQRDAKAKSAKL
jgi:2-dehydropantoate 2-reductase